VRSHDPRLASRLLVWGGFALGLALRLSLLWHASTGDMPFVFIPFGRDVLEQGLAQAYQGAYFPVQYQILEVFYWLSRLLAIDPQQAVNIGNLLFEVGNFALLLALSNRLRFHPALSLVYWLHPYFLVMFALGYVDCEFAFFNLAAVTLLAWSKDWRGDLVAGIPIAIAFLMKPQAQALIAALGIYALVRFASTKKLSSFSVFVPSVLLFAAYAIFFFAAGRGIYFLGTYVRTLSVMPCLTAQMPNFWYPIAYAIKAPGTTIYSVSDQTVLFAGIRIVDVAMALSLGAIAAFIVLVKKRNTTPSLRNWPLLLSLCVADFVIPFLMTSAHENHFFSGAVLFIAILSCVKDRVLHVAFHVILLIQFINLNVLYGDWKRFGDLYSGGVRCAFAIVSVLMFAAIYGRLLKLYGGHPEFGTR
jgi:hypothetical protein